VQIARNLEDSQTVTVNRTFCLKANRRAWHQPLLRCPQLIVGYEGVRLTLEGLTLGVPTGHDIMLDLQRGASCELVDCRLQKGGIRLGTNSSAALLRTSVSDARCAGIIGNNFDKVTLTQCQLTRCLGDGLSLGKGCSVEVVDCTFADNAANGAVLTDGSSNWHFERCTFSGNGQYGVWLDAGAKVAWGQNSLLANGLGEKGGKGHLQGWLPGISFRQGDDCAVWSEDQGQWLQGRVREVCLDSITVRVHQKNETCKAQKLSQTCAKPFPAVDCQQEAACLDLTVRSDAVRQPISGDSGVPPWSTWFAKPDNAYQLFLREGGGGKQAWMNTNVTVRDSFKARAQKLQAKRKVGKDNTLEKDRLEATQPTQPPVKKTRL